MVSPRQLQVISIGQKLTGRHRADAHDPQRPAPFARMQRAVFCRPVLCIGRENPSRLRNWHSPRQITFISGQCDTTQRSRPTCSRTRRAGAGPRPRLPLCKSAANRQRLPCAVSNPRSLGCGAPVHQAELHSGLGKHGLNGIGEALQVIQAGNEDVGHATILQFGHDLQPELGALRLGHPQAQPCSFPKYNSSESSPSLSQSV